jgi:translocation and assembly module TamB
MSTIFRYLLIGFLLTVFFVISLVCGVLYTETGTKMVWELAYRNLDILSGELESGTLSSGVKLNNFSLDLDFMTLKADRIALKWDLSEILSTRLTVNSLDAGKIDMRLNFDKNYHNEAFDGYMLALAEAVWKGGADGDFDKTREEYVLDMICRNNARNYADKSLPSYVDLPVEIIVESVKIDSYTLDSDIFLLQIEDLGVSARLNQHQIADAKVSASMLDFFLKDSEDVPAGTLPVPEVKNGFDRNEVMARIETLPTVHIPFDIDIANLDLKKVRYHMTGYDTDLIDLTIQGDIRQSRINLQPAVIRSRQYGDFDIRGTVTLEDYLPLNLDLDAVVQYDVLDGQLKGLPLKGHVGGQLTELDVRVETQDERKIGVSALLNVLDGIITSKARVTYSHVTWPLKPSAGEVPVAELKNGEVNFEGDLGKFDIDLKSAVKLGEGSFFDADVAAAGLVQDFTVERVKLSRKDHGSLDLAAKLKFTDNEIIVNDIVLESRGNPFKPILGRDDVSRLNGKLEGNVLYHLDSSTVDFKLSQTKFEGQYTDNPFTYHGEIDGTVNIGDLLQSKVTARGVNLSVGETKLGIDGEISPSSESNFKLSLNCPDLNRLTRSFMPEALNGSLNLNASVKGTSQKPSIELGLDVKNFARGQDIQIPAITLKARESFDLVRKNFNGTVELLIPSIKSGEKEFRKVSLKLDGDARKHKIAFSADGKPDLGVNAIFLGRLSENGDYTLMSPKLDILTPIRTYALESGMLVEYRASSGEIKAKPFTFLNTGNSLIFQKLEYYLNSGALALDLKIKRFNTFMLRRYLPEDVMVNASFNGNVSVSRTGNGSPVTANVELHSKNGSISNMYSQAKFSNIDLTMNFIQDKTAAASFLLDGGRYGTIRFDANYDLSSSNRIQDKVLTVDINNMDLELFAPMAPMLEVLQGKINSKGNVIYEPGKKRYYFVGFVGLDDGKIVTSSDIADVSNLKFRLDVNREQLKLDSSFSMGDGRGTVTGDLDLDPVYSGDLPKGDIKLDATNLNLKLAGYGSARVDYHLLLAFLKQNGKVKLNATGKVDIPWSRIVVKDVESSGQSTSSDVVVLERRGEKLNVEEVPHQSFVEYKVDLNIGPDVNIKAFGLNTNMAGKLLITNHNEDHALGIYGTVNFVDGKFRALGHNLLMRKGKIDFTGPVSAVTAFVEAIRDPETITDGSGVVVGVRVIKTVNHIDMKIFSEPQMSESEKLSYLLNGVGLTGQDQDTAAMATTSMLLNAGLSTASSSVSELASGIGLNDFRLETTNGDQVTASAYITKKLKVSYGFGIANSIGELKLRYELMSKLFVQFVNSTDNAVDLFYSFSFD